MIQAAAAYFTKEIILLLDGISAMALPSSSKVEILFHEMADPL